MSRPGPAAVEPGGDRDGASPRAGELDLAFQLDPEPDAAMAELHRQAGTWADGARAPLAWQELLSAWLQRLHPELPPSLQAPAYSLGLALVDDASIAELNQDWRQHPGPTDVLAFAAQEQAPALPQLLAAGEPLELGDIVISLQTAARQAEGQGHDLERELLFLASHGLLHLLGWDHPDEVGLAAMLARQEALLAGPEPGTG